MFFASVLHVLELAKKGLLTNTTGWIDFSFSHLKTVIQRSGEHTPNAVNMQTYGVHKYFMLEREKNHNIKKKLSWIFFKKWILWLFDVTSSNYDI